MSNHLREIHHKDLIIRLPLQGPGYDMGYRVQFTIDIMKNSESKVFYDYKTAIFAPPIIPISTPYRAYDKYKVKKEVTIPGKGPKKERK